MQRRYITVDVFTDRAFGGNPLAVVLDAGGLSTAQMQAIATEFNYSETTFVLPPRDPAHDAQVRIFTVNREIPFAGHPNVGTAFVLATQAAKPPARLQFEESAGLVPVEILTEQGKVVGTELTAPQPLKRMSQLQRRAGGGLPLAVGGRYQDRPASAADHLGRAAVPGRGSRLARGAAAGEARCRGVRQNLPVRRQRRGLFLHARRAGRREALRPAGADVPSRRERPVRRSRHRQRHGGRRGAARRSRRDAGRRIEAADRAGRRHGPAEPAADARAQGERRGRVRRMSAAAACR